MADCLFCSLPPERILHENEWAWVIFDAYPVTEHHALVIPKRHVPGYFDLDDEEVAGCHSLLGWARGEILRRDASVSGFNVGINMGRDAGQTIFHCHIHLIPRRPGDVVEPRGGVRHVVPGKGDY